MLGKLFDKKDDGPHMPPVEISADHVKAFALARQMSSGAGPSPDGTSSERGVAIVTPGRLIVKQPSPAAGSMPPDAVAQIQSLVPTPPKNIAVIAYTQLETLMKNIQQGIPFLGFLLGFAYIGHTVWVFEGHVSALADGCRDADLLIVDSGMVPHLTPAWVTIARSTMRGRDILIFDRIKGGVTAVP